MKNNTKKPLLPLPPADEELGPDPEVLSKFAMVSDFKKRIEQAGKGYAELQLKVEKQKDGRYAKEQAELSAQK
jgi:hypothetical protein